MDRISLNRVDDDGQSRQTITNHIGETHGLRATNLLWKTNSQVPVIYEKPFTNKITAHVQLMEKQTDLNDKTEINTLQILLNNYQDIFSKGEFDIGTFKNERGEREPLHIKVKDSTKIINITPGRMPYAYRLWLNQYLEGLEKAGVIEQVTAQTGPCWNSPPLIVTKANGKPKVCIDLRLINKEIITHTYQMLEIV